MAFHDSRAIANRLIERAIDENTRFTPLQVIKLVYFCHGWMLGLCKRPLMIHPVWAWQYGPVVEEVYHSLKQHGGNPIPSSIPNIASVELDDDQKNIVGQVYDKYGKLDGITLSQLTHAPGTPWDHIWHASGKNSIIPNSLIQQHYELLVYRRDQP